MDITLPLQALAECLSCTKGGIAGMLMQAGVLIPLGGDWACLQYRLHTDGQQDRVARTLGYFGFVHFGFICCLLWLYIWILVFTHAK
jgi:hypothetical protein